jgi:multiple sugar transport system ATP-binding protein
VEAMTMADKIVIMNEGLIQQVGGPFEVYNNPANIFVAGFIGTPPMNFLNVKVARNNGIWFKSEGISIKVPDDKAPLLENYIDKDVIFGVRPEDIYDKDFFEGADESNILNAMVDVVEPLGSETLLHLTINGQSMTAKVSPQTRAESGQNFEVAIDLKMIHAFDKETEQAIF